MDGCLNQKTLFLFQMFLNTICLLIINEKFQVVYD